MADKSWYVSKDGVQLPGEMDTAAVKALVASEPGRSILVWAPGMANWTVPSSLPEFAPEPVRPAAAAPAQAAPAAPAAARPAMPMRAPSKAEMQEHAGAFRSLFDTSFDTLITQKIIRAVYTVVLVLVCLGVVLGVLGGLVSGLMAMRLSVISGLISVIVAVVVVPLVGIIYLALIRVSLEVVIVIFRIKDDVRLLAEKKG